MVEVEWDGVELPPHERQSLSNHLWALARAIDPDGRARLRVEIASAGHEYRVAVAGRDELVQLGAEAQGADLPGAMTRAVGLALTRWRAARAERSSHLHAPAMLGPARSS